MTCVKCVAVAYIWSHLREFASLWDRARLNTVTTQHTGAWLQAISNRKLGLTMPSKEVRIACITVLTGYSMFHFNSDAKCCACGIIIDSCGDYLPGM